MASLWYEALAAHDPSLAVDRVEKFARSGIDEFVQYLQLARNHQERAAIRASWQRDDEEDERRDGSVWVELCAPTGNVDRFEKDAKKFFADQVRELYEAEPAASDAERDRPQFDESRRIAVLDVDENSSRLLLEREPELEHLLLRPNTYALHRQIQAMRQLRNEPRPENLPLLRLLGPARPKDGVWPGGREIGTVEWPEPTPCSIDTWYVLDKDIEGVEEQRGFVAQALSSPDFAVLEGPPGSGKTTVICELVMQLVERGKRVLLCASTHVAVDNVLERLKSETHRFRDHVLAVRIGDRHNVSVKARPYRLDEFKQTTRTQITTHLQQQRGWTPAQEEMLRALRGDDTMIERLVLECANLVCGTTIGILQHPDIKAQKDERRGVDAAFDVLIVDEASKTTFQEFLVPGLLANRWILAGDPLQLSPYVEDDEVAASVQAAMPNPEARHACLDVFDNHRSPDDPSGWKPTVVVSDDPAVHELYAAQAAAHGVQCVDGEAADWASLHSAPLILATSDGVSRSREWPADLAVIHGEFDGVEQLRRRARAFWDGRDRLMDEDRSWESEIAWRLSREYEQRLFERDGVQSATAQRYRRDRQLLLPAAGTGIKADGVSDYLTNIQRIALPSVLESLRYGFGRKGAITPTTLSEGLPQAVLAERHTRLTYQRRMHPEISAFPREHVYHGHALIDPPDMMSRREWPNGGPRRYSSRAEWLDVKTLSKGHSREEIAVVIEELRQFMAWAARNPRPDGQLWEAAVLTFYRAQEKELRWAIRGLSGERHAMQESVLKHSGVPVVSAHVCTVDRFQGHEADIVLLSVANGWPTSFLESPNRINVAVTRARYQLVVVGNRHEMLKCRSPVLGGLARSLKYGLRFNSAKGGRTS
ncbi:MAG: AAA family ATPase [Phycisphaerales bacterium]|nr:AAA family ATPase [Phycisphaerales bacterium]